MVTSAIDAYNTILARGVNDIAEVRSITGPKKTLSAIDVTHLTSPNNYREFIGGLRDGGEITLDGNFYPGDTNGQIGLSGDLDAATVQDFTVTFPAASGTVWTFKGLVTAFETGAVIDDRLTFAVTIKVTAKPDLGITTSADATGLDIDEETGYPGVNTGVPTPFAGATYEYSYVLNTASTWFTIKVTHATAATITVHNDANDLTTPLLTTVESGNLPLSAADTITTLTVTCTVANQIPVVYTVYLVRP